MCGIVGIFNRDSRPVDAVSIKRMADALQHRGPDGEGVFTENGIGLGHRRLSIIDPELGHQPMYCDDQSVVVVFNGEIYNYKEVRADLSELGHKFRTDSDTEVILHAYLEWGVDCQTRFNGMWAFAIWDSRKNRLFLSRDRIGEKP